MKQSVGYITIEKQDSESSDIKISGVVFDIYDEDANFIESIITDENGFAKSSLLIIDKNYYVMETSTNPSYILSNKLYKVNFIENKTEEDIEKITEDVQYSLIIENEAKTGILEIIKVDADNNEYRIPDVEFEVIDETLNKIVGEVTTDSNRKSVNR